MIPYAEAVPTRWGHVVALKCDSYQYQALTLYGEWAHDEMAICLDLVKAGDVVLDIGANIGSTALPFARKVGPSGTVMAFEPQRLPYYCLCGTLVLNGVAEWARPCNAAVGDSEGTVDVPNIDPTKPNNAGGVRVDSDVWEKYLNTKGPKSKAKLLTVDSLKLDKVDFMKIDVESMESKVLRGAAQTIQACKPVIWAEALHHAPDNRKEMAEFFESYNYQVWEFVTPVYSPRNVRLCHLNPYENQGDVNVLAIHKDQTPPPITEKVIRFKP